MGTKKPTVVLAVGDVIRILLSDEIAYQAGTRATLTKKDKSGSWWACFYGHKNVKGSYVKNRDNVWCVGRLGLNFVKYEL